MELIKAEVSKEKGSKKVTYSFEINNDVFKAYYFPGKKPALELTHNENALGTIDQPNKKIDYTVNSGTTPLKITAWLYKRSIFASLTGIANGIGIEVDGKPVQHTLASPETHINYGRGGLYILLFLLIFKSSYTYYSTYTEYVSHIIAGITSLIYFIPFAYILITTIKFKSWTTLALISGIIISALELIDYLAGIPGSITSGSGSFVVWIFIRVCVLITLCSAYNWKRKEKKGAI